MPCLWYRVDSGDRDPASFFYHMGLAVNQAADQTNPHLPLLTAEYLQGLDTFTMRYFEKLSRRFSRSVWIVFDNFQEVPADSPLQGILNLAMRHIGSGMKLCIISRSDPGPLMARLLANRIMEHIDGAQLAFSVEEYRQVLQVLGQDRNVLQKAEALHQLTGGWIAGLILWLQHARSVAEIHATDTQPPAIIFDYFANEVLERLAPSVRQFLLWVSFLFEMTAENTARLTGNPAAGKILESFARRNFFLEKSSDMPIRYRFHALFRQFLQDRALKTLAPDLLQDLIRRSAVIMAETGLWNESVRLYEQAKDWKALSGLILSQAPQLAAQGRFKTLAEWLDRLPSFVCEKNPYLLLWTGISRILIQPREGRKVCRQAFESFKSTNDMMGQVMSWCPIVDSFFLLRSEFQELDKWIEEGLRIAGMLSDSVNPDLYGRFCSGMIGAFLWRKPSHPDMPRWQEMGEELLAVSNDPQTAASLLNVLCFSYNWFGQANKVRALRARLNSIMERFSRNPMLQALRSANEGMYFLMEGRPEECLRLSELALQCANEIGIHIYDSLFLSARVYGALLLENIEAADTYLQEMADRILPEAKWDWTNYYALSTMKAVLENDIPRAKILADENLEMLESCGTPYNIAYMTIIHAQVMLCAEDTIHAQSDLDRVAVMNILPHIVLLKFLHELTAADIAIVKDRQKEAIDHLQRAFSTAAENGCYFIFGVNRNRLPILCALALETGIETSYVGKLIQSYRLLPPAMGVTGDSWPYDIKIYTLGRLEIHHKDKPLALSSTKTPRKTLDMLMTLICAGRKGIPREKIADLLWPETDGDRAHQNMNTTLHRLRRLLNQEDAVENENGRLVLSMQYCWVDAWSFEALFDQAMHSRSLSEKEKRLKKAVALYTGPMEADAVAEISLSYTERLKSKFARIIIELGSLLYENDKTEEALDLYRSALDIEDSSENLYQAMIGTLNILGRATESIEMYRKCCMVLKTKYGTEPSPQTRALYRKATASSG